MSTQDHVVDRSAAAIGPHALRLSAEPTRVRDALELLLGASNALEGSRQSLEEAAGAVSPRGSTTRALDRAVRSSAFTALRDRKMLDDLARALRRFLSTLLEAEGFGDDRLDVRWGRARNRLTEAMSASDGGQGPMLAEAIGAELVEPYRPLLETLVPDDPATGHPTAAAAPRAALQGAPEWYRDEVGAILAELAGGVRALREAQGAVRSHLAWRPRDRQPEQEPDGQADDGISDTAEIERLCEALDTGATALEELVPRLSPIAAAVEDGLLPDELIDVDVFVHEWRGHLERRVRRMRLVSATGRRMATDMARLDDQAAAEIALDRD